MPIDTAKKRKAAVPGTLPTPDGVIDAADRAHVAGVYTVDTSTPDLGTELFLVSAVKITVDVKTVRDRGDETSSATVPVTVTFNKTFADIISIDVFPVTTGTEKIFRVIDFVDVADPTSFEVTLINSDGDQVSRPFGWVVEGVLKYS